MSHEGRSLTTAAVRAALVSDEQHGAVVPPLVLSSNFAFEGLERPRRYDYTRSGNPTRDQLAETLAELEGARRAVVCSSGMAAVAVVLHTVPQGGCVVAPRDCYGGTWRLLDAWSRQGRFELRWIDPRDPAQRAQALADGPSLLWLETPSNPLMRVTDLAEVCAEARRHGTISVVDNTFLSPVLQQPLRLGADLVVHSTTKYLNGHSDVVGGAVCCADEGLGEQVAWWANAVGCTGAPFDAFLTLRGVRTLGARMRVHEENASAVSQCLAEHPAVVAVHDPRRPDHPDHACAVRQQSGFGGMLSFELSGGRSAVEVLVGGLREFTLAESLGGVESLVCHPATMTHAAMSPEARAAAGIGEGLVRLSVGIEDEHDLVADLRRALDACSELSRGPRSRPAARSAASGAGRLAPRR